MPKITKENQMEEKLKYIGLDLENIPTFFEENQKMEYRPVKTVAENQYKVYRYIPISKINILLTPMNRLNTLKEKYASASNIMEYLKPKTEEDIIKHTTFLKMLNSINIEEIEKIEEEQKNLNKQIPFKVKYSENYLWQIYYSEQTDTYFMLVPTEDLEYASFFYLLKKQIEYIKNKKEEMIFVPIAQEEYSGEYLKVSEISDLEKYVWQLTKHWPNIYEVQDKKGQKSIQVVGITTLYENIKTDYKVVLKTKEETQEFYQLLKALFILETSLPYHYNFVPQINAKAELEFLYQDKKVDYEKLITLLKGQYEKAQMQIRQNQIEESRLEKQLQKLKEKSVKQEHEYRIKEKEIATYLEYRKTFLGKVRYFFRSKKMKKQEKNKVNIEKKIQTKEDVLKNGKEKLEFVKKEYYTIEDIVTIYKALDAILAKVTNLKLDSKALENKIQNMGTKIKNAKLYIDEIDKHEKSIFEFWKFANKDESLMLTQGAKDSINQNPKLEKVFDYENDFEDVLMQMDRKQRSNQDRKDTESIFVATTNVLEAINNIEDDIKLQESLNNLKKELLKTKTYSDVDLFGNVAEVKIQVLGNKKHRENKKDIFRILEITKNTTLQEYKKKLLEIRKVINKNMEDMYSIISIPVYKAQLQEDQSDLQIFELLPEKEIQRLEREKEINLYKINLKEEKSPVLYFTNSIFYYNENKTLPLGMNIETKCLIDKNKYIGELKEKQEFYVSHMVDEFKISTTKVKLYVYEENEEENK